MVLTKMRNTIVKLELTTFYVEMLVLKTYVPYLSQESILYNSL